MAFDGAAFILECRHVLEVAPLNHADRAAGEPELVIDELGHDASPWVQRVGIESLESAHDTPGPRQVRNVAAMPAELCLRTGVPTNLGVSRRFAAQTAAERSFDARPRHALVHCNAGGFRQ